MNAETFTTSARALIASADVASTNEERAALITHQLVKYTPVALCLDVKTALFALEDRLTAGMVVDTVGITRG